MSAPTLQDIRACFAGAIPAMVATCSAIFTWPSDEAGIVKPRVCARLRSAVLANSRPMLSATIQAGARSSWTSEMKAAEVSSLSAIGSSICPSHVTCRRRLAR